MMKLYEKGSTIVTGQTALSKCSYIYMSWHDTVKGDFRLSHFHSYAVSCKHLNYSSEFHRLLTHILSEAHHFNKLQSIFNHGLAQVWSCKPPSE